MRLGKATGGEFAARSKIDTTIAAAIKRVQAETKRSDISWVASVRFITIGDSEKRVAIQALYNERGGEFRGAQEARIEHAATPFSVLYFDPLK